LPPDEEGNKFIIVIIDIFSRYVTLHAGKDASGNETALEIHKHIFVYGIPTHILTDNGSQFLMKLSIK
jgi:transposase InsO family protein